MTRKTWKTKNIGMFMFSILPLAVRINGIIVRPRHCHGRPKHIHLAVGKDPSTRMTISFASKLSTPGENAPVGEIHLGLNPENLDRVIQEQEFPVSYVTSHAHEDWGEYYSPFQHHISIDDLTPNTTYYYMIVTRPREFGTNVTREKRIKEQSLDHLQENMLAENKILSQQELNDKEEESGRRLIPIPYDGSEMPCIEYKNIRRFKTVPNTTTGPVTFAIIGDLGQFEHSKETMADMSTRLDTIDAVILVGDIAYTNNDHRAWDTFFDFLDDFSIFDEVPVQIATGNHDIDKHENRSEIFQAYEARFRMPRLHPAELGVYNGPLGPLDTHKPPYPLPYEWGNAYYSFIYGPAKHIVISAYSSMEPGSTQYEWILQEFVSIDRNITPWVLVTIHVPIYNTFSTHPKELQINAAKQHLEPLLVQHHVNMIFTGHIHAYQRTANVAMGKLDPTGPIHITIGAGGRQCYGPFINATAEEWIMTRDASHYGYGLFNIYNKTHAEWRWIPLSPSDPYNYVKKQKDKHLPMVQHDSVVVNNQYFSSA